MKSNLIIIGDNEKLNKILGKDLADYLELNYLDFDDYCDYINLVSREEVIKKYGKQTYNELQKDALPHMQDFCDSVIAFDGKISRLPSVFKLLKDTSYIVCVCDKDKERYAKYTDIWVKAGKKSKKAIMNEIIRRLGEIE